MTKIAGLPAKVHSSGIHRIPAGIRGALEVLSVPPYSCCILVIPVDSGGIPAKFISQNFTPATKLCNSGIYTGEKEEA